VLLAVLDPLTWQRLGPVPWFAPAGLGLALALWFGPRAVLLVLLARAVAVGCGAFSMAGTSALLPALLDIPLTAGETLAAWWLLRRLRVSRGLGDPQSAVFFILLAPGAVAVAFAVLRAAVCSPESLNNFGWLALSFWLGRALGVMTLAVPLLTGATAFLVRRGWISAETATDAPMSQQDLSGARRLTAGDWIEVSGLAAGAGLLTVVLSLRPGTTVLDTLQLWGAPLLLIVWACIRQGLFGGTLAAGMAAALPLLVLTIVPRPTTGRHDLVLLLLQGNLFAECAAALLVGASAAWVRLSEARFRHVVGEAPVLLYCARFVEQAGGRAAGRRLPPIEIVLVSAASQTLLGCPPEALLGKLDHWLERVHASDREILLAAVGQLARQKEPVTCEYRLDVPPPPPPPDSDMALPLAAPRSGLYPVQEASERWVRDTLAPQLDSAGKLLGWEGAVVDVSGQRALAGDLRRTTAVFNTLVANLPAGVFFVQGATGQPILVNARARQLLGRREDVSAGVEHFVSTYRLQRPDGTPYPVDELPVVQALRFGRTVSRDDLVVLRPDGHRVPLLSWAAPVDLGGHARETAAVWVLEELTLLRQAEEAWRQTEGRLRAVVEALAEGLIVLDRAGCVVDANPTGSALLGGPVERLPGHVLSMLPIAFLREDGTTLTSEEQPWNAVLATGRPVRNVLLGLAAKSGRETGTRWVLVNAMPLTPSSSDGVVVTLLDVTAFRRAQDLVRSSEERYRHLLESMPVMLVRVDHEGRLVYVNPAVRETSGYSLEEMGRPEQWEKLVMPEWLEQAQQLLAITLAGKPSHGEFRYRAKDGTVRVCYAFCSPNREGDEPGATAVLLDITRERRLEQELERSRRLELVGRLAGGVVHDFNNLLAVVLGLSELARVHLPVDHPAHEDLRRLTDAGEKASDLAGQLLNLSRNKQSPPRRLDLNRIIRQALDLLRPTLRGDVQILTDLAPGELPIVAVEAPLQQVLMNLCLNARDAMRSGGRLHVRTAGADEVRLTVEDEGEGMSEEVRRHVFDAFFTTKEHGTGLGLAIVQQIVESFGGRVEVTSQVGRGTRFDVVLPRSTS
jgi:PAS domain S-box-containing protein